MTAPVISSQPHMPIAEIIVGKRFRKDLGDIAALAESMRADGLLRPIVVTRDGRLVLGARCLVGAKLLDWSTVPVTVVDDLTEIEIVRAELAENTHRKGFTLSEAVAIKRELEPLERAEAKQRQLATLKRGDKKPVVQTLHNGAKTRDRVAACGGVSPAL